MRGDSRGIFPLYTFRYIDFWYFSFHASKRVKFDVPESEFAFLVIKLEPVAIFGFLD